MATAEVAKIAMKQYSVSIIKLAKAYLFPDFNPVVRPYLIAVTPTGPGGRAKTNPANVPISIALNKSYLQIVDNINLNFFKSVRFY